MTLALPLLDASIVTSIHDFFEPMWVEVLFMTAFVLSFAILRAVPFGTVKPIATYKQKKMDAPMVNLVKTIKAEVGAGHALSALKAWRMSTPAHSVDTPPLPHAAFKLVVQALVEADPEALVGEVVSYMCHHQAHLGTGGIAVMVLDIVARAGQVEMVEQLYESLRLRLRMKPTTQMCEVLLGCYASAGDEARVDKLSAQVSGARLSMTARGFSLTIKGFLKNGMLDATLRQVLEMKRHCFNVPPFALVHLARIACAQGRAAEALEVVHKGVTLPSEAVVCLLEDCIKRNDVALARHMDQLAHESVMPLVFSAYHTLLKLYVQVGDLRAIELFAEMDQAGLRISEGLCVSILARSAESKFLRFAEEVWRFVKARGDASIATYSALMKVYKYSGMYDKACDLYDQIRADGLEPDATMYGCLMQIAVKCGRTGLAQQLSEKAPSLDIENYMGLIRAAGRDKDVETAFAVLEKLKASGLVVDRAAYNCVLDVCVSSGDMKRARALVDEMRASISVDIITYNVLLKGYCVKSDLQGGRNLLKEMEREGYAPNDVSFNCLINAAVCANSFHEAWELIDMMEAAGVAIDHYTVSIMMKSLKNQSNQNNVSRTLALLDRSGLDAWSDEIMLNTVLETCIKHCEFQRLEAILSRWEHQSMLPSAHTYAVLIKAYGALKLVDDCYKMWNELVVTRATEPSDLVLGCMIHALVCNHHIDEAVDLHRKFKSKIKSNTAICSTLMKGFVNCRQGDRAIAMWREMREGGMAANTVLYNTVIDSQARAGAMDHVSEVFAAMKEDGCQPDTITYSTIIKGYCVTGDLDKALEVFSAMRANGWLNPKDAVIYNTILDGCSRHGRMDLVDGLIEDMRKGNVTPSNHTLGILIKISGRRWQLDRAFELVETLTVQHGFEANAQVQTCLMCTCIGNKDLPRALQVFEQMKAAPHGADAKAYAALISGCTCSGHLNKALELVQEAYGLAQGVDGKSARRRLQVGQNIDSKHLERLLRALWQQGRGYTQAAPLLEALRAAGVPINGQLVSMMANGDDDPNSMGHQGGQSHVSSKPWRRCN